MTISRLGLFGLIAFLFTLVVGPTALAAQSSEPAPDRETMTRFVRAHMAINEARDEFHGQVARVHDPEGRVRAREEVEARIDGILEEQELTREEYDAITLRISLDSELRATFDELLVELQEVNAPA